MNEEEELKLALELSAHAEREHANSLLSHDEELARALEESLLDTPAHPGIRPGSLVVDSVNVASSSTSTKPRDANSHSSKTSSLAASPLLAPSPVDVQLKEDEELARRLEAEYEDEPTTPTTERIHADPSPPVLPPLPRYTDVVGKETGTYRCNVSSLIS
jgi:hypothetical protein